MTEMSSSKYFWSMKINHSQMIYIFQDQKLVCLNTEHRNSTVEIQDFPEVEVPTLQGDPKHTILPIFSKNCMKLKEFGSQGGYMSKILLCRSATAPLTSLG